jgi:hypothetical protein
LIFSNFLFNSNSESDFNFLKMGYEMKFIKEKSEEADTMVNGQILMVNKRELSKLIINN